LKGEVWQINFWLTRETKEKDWTSSVTLFLL
jgi:hypothetical protein